ncbi:MAG: hypothetical protein KGN02_06000 [bacterium]|nr:hypothetical protein [bacterium]
MMLSARISLERGNTAEMESAIDRVLAREEPSADIYGMAAQLFARAGHARANDLTFAGVERFPTDERLIRLARSRRAYLAPGPRDVVAVLGNCQAEMLCDLAAQVPALARRFRFVPVPTYAVPGKTMAAISRDITSAVLLWDQYEMQPGTRALRETLRATVPSTCRIVTYPPVGMLACWPFASANRYSQPGPGFPWGPFPLGDRIANELIAQGVSRKDAVARYLELSRAKMPDPRRLLERDRRLWDQAEEACDVKIAEFEYDNFRTTRLFISSRHPTNADAAELLARLCAASEDALGIDTSLVRLQLSAVLPDTPEHAAVSVPLHPDVIERLGIEYCDSTTRYAWFGNAWTFEEYIERYIARDTDWQARGWGATA